MPHQLFEALIAHLPAEGEVMTEERRGAFLRTFDSMLDLVYATPAALGGGSVPAEPLLLEAPATEAVAPPHAARPAVKATSKPTSTASTVQPKAAHTGRHLFRDGTCGKNGCGAIDPRGASDPKHNPFMQPATTSAPQVVATAPLTVTAPPTTEAPIRYCSIQGCHEAVGLGGRCADGHVQGGRA